MSDSLHCWKCAASLDDLPQPLARRASCPACGADLHVCRQCRHYDTGKAKQCRELAADDIRDKTRANFCEWFQARSGQPGTVSGAAGNSRAALDALFGGPSPSPGTTGSRDALDQLFGKE